MPITAPPTIPVITDPSTFAVRAQDWVVWQAEQLYPELTSQSLLLGLSLSGTSVTSNAVGTGSKSFTVETGKGFAAGQSLVIARTSAPTNRMFVVVTSYNSGTGALVVTSQAFEGSGTFTDWTISPTLNAVLTLVQVPDLLITNAKLAQQYINDLTAVEFDSGNDYIPIADASDSGNKKKAKIPSIQKISDLDASVAANELTITINAGVWDFRSTTLTDGTPITRTLSSPVSVVVPSGATLGTVGTVAARLAVVLIDNSGTLEAAVVNLAGGNQLDETNLITTTTIDTGSDSNNVIYSTTGRTSVAYRVIGFIDITEATAGTWATAPTLVQGCGGQAFAAMSSLGYGQTWQTVTRTSGTTYYNTTGKPIVLHCSTASGITGTISINGLTVANQTASAGTIAFVSALIPAGSSYVLTATTQTFTVELR
jgi:hypothetical protein